MKLNADNLVSWFQKTYPETVTLMKNCDHHFDRETSLNPYHLEGDVWTHTMMVVKQAELEDCEFKDELLVLALLHDIGKHLVREEKNNKTYFTNHDALSAFYSLDIIKTIKGVFQCSIDADEIFKVIALHTQPYRKELKDLVNEIDSPESLYLLLKLAKCDHVGRFSFKGNSTQFSNCDLETIKLHWLSLTEYQIPKNPLEEVVLMCGLPASGKSTYINNQMKSKELEFIIKPWAKVVSRDDCVLRYFEKRGIRKPYSELFALATKEDQKEIDKLLQEKFKEAKDSSQVVVDMTHMSKKSRRRTLSHFQNRNKKCICFLTDLKTTFARNKDRYGKKIPINVYDQMMKAFYLPSCAEGFSKVYYV